MDVTKIAFTSRTGLTEHCELLLAWASECLDAAVEAGMPAPWVRLREYAITGLYNDLCTISLCEKEYWLEVVFIANGLVYTTSRLGRFELSWKGIQKQTGKAGFSVPPEIVGARLAQMWAATSKYWAFKKALKHIPNPILAPNQGRLSLTTESQ
jgi:hypothetical protein